MMQRAITIGALAFSTLVMLFCTGLLGAFLDTALQLTFGWMAFLWRVGPKITIAPVAVATALICTALLAIGSHLFLGWLVPRVRTRSSTEAVASKWHARWTAMLLSLVVLLFAAGISVVGMTHQLAWLVRSEERILEPGTFRLVAIQMQSANNLKQIGLAVQNYHDVEGRLPPGSTFGPNGEAMHGWQTFLLPYLEQDNVFRRMTLQKSWKHPDNRKAVETVVHLYQHPTLDDHHDGQGLALSHYAANVRVLGGEKPRSLESITDGTANTILTGEVWTNFSPWGRPGNWRDPALGLHTTNNSFGTPISEQSRPITQFLMADGSVRSCQSDVSRELLKTLATPDGGERHDLDW